MIQWNWLGNIKKIIFNKFNETNQESILLSSITYRGNDFHFDLVFIKKNNEIKFFFKKTKTSSNQLVAVWFGPVQFFRTKQVQTGLARFFFQFGFGSSRFFRFQTYKTETEPVGFFKILIGLIGFFSRFGFFGYFFMIFSV